MGFLNYNYFDLTKKISKLGFFEKRKAKGDHIIRANDTMGKEISIPNHGKKSISKGIIKVVIRISGLSNKEFSQL